MLLVLGLMFFCANGDIYAAASLLSDIAKDLNIPLSAAVLSVTAYMTAMGIFTLIFGPLSDRFGKVRVINTAAFGTAVFSILGAVSFNQPSLAFFRTMNGIFGAGIFPITLALVGESFDAGTRQRALGKVTGLGFLGAATATAIGGSLAYFGSWRFVYFIYGLRYRTAGPGNSLYFYPFHPALRHPGTTAGHERHSHVHCRIQPLSGRCLWNIPQCHSHESLRH